MLHCKVYLSDEGFGHLVRQEAVIKNIVLKNPNIVFTIQTKNKYKFAVEKFSKFKNIYFIDCFNNIETYKNVDGSLDLVRTKKYFQNFEKNSKTFIAREIKNFKYDFVISDAVPEAHEIAKKMSVPSFSIFHFNWAWFCKKLYPELDSVYSRMLEMYRCADVVFLPPFPPKETVKNFNDKSFHVPFIINSFDSVDIKKTQKKKILVMDNGTSTLSKIIIENFNSFDCLQDYHFYVPKNLAKSDSSNITRIEGVKNIHSHIPLVDAIVARAGYNTLTESLISKVPALFVNETKNPEIKHNIDEVFSRGLGSKMTVLQYKNDFVNCFENFIKNDYNNIMNNLLSHDYKSDGAEVIADNILKFLKVAK
jgi:uncharacterized protein (TIGR00661 family)